MTRPPSQQPRAEVRADECFSPELVLGLLDNDVDEATRERANVHLDRCEECRSWLVYAQRTAPMDERSMWPPRYAPSRELGRGGMGVVYLAWDETLERDVAVKVRRDGSRSAGGSSEVRRGDDALLRESKVVAGLKHPNIVMVHDVVRLDGRVFVVMEYVEGGTLRRWMTAEKRDWAEILTMFLGAGEGLAAAHREGVVHGDFKPDNVLIGREGLARVTDFGLARRSLFSTDEGEMDSGSAGAPAAGTPAYMAPEQLEGRGSSASADLFSFCASAWEGLFGVRPFEAEGRASRLTAIQRARPSGSDTRPAVPEPVVALLRQGLAFHPEQRPESMAALVADLRDAIPGARARPRWGLAVGLVGAAALAMALVAGGGTPTVGSVLPSMTALDCVPPSDLLSDEFEILYERLDDSLNEADDPVRRLWWGDHGQEVRAQRDALDEHWQRTCEAPQSERRAQQACLRVERGLFHAVLTKAGEEFGTARSMIDLDDPGHCLSLGAREVEARFGWWADDPDRVAALTALRTAAWFEDGSAQPGLDSLRAAVADEPGASAQLEFTAMRLDPAVTELLPAARKVAQQAKSADLPGLWADASLRAVLWSDHTPETWAELPYDIELAQEGIERLPAGSMRTRLEAQARRAECRVATYEQRLGDARAACEAALASPATKSAEMAGLLSDLSVILLLLREPAAAVPIAQEMVRWREAHDGPGSGNVLQARATLASAHLGAGDLDSASDTLDRASDAFERGSVDDITRARLLYFTAAAYAKLGDLQAGEALWNEAGSIAPDPGPGVAIMRNISACRLGSLRLEVTATDVAACRTWAQAVSGTAPESAASAQMWLATVLVRTKDRREAMRLAGAALSELETHQASGLDTFRLTAAEILLEGGDTEGAESLLAELELRGPTPREQARLDFARGLAGVEPQSSRVLVTGARATLGRHPSLNRRRLAEIDAWLEANGR